MAMRRAKNKLKPRTYHEVEDLVDIAVGAGIRRAHKHSDTPSHDHIQEQITREVMSVLADVVAFPVERKATR